MIPLFDQLIPDNVRNAPVGAIYEWRADTLPLAIGRRVVQQGGAALIIDYGHVKSAPGETLQAVGAHAFVNPLLSPGQVDLTAHVDFQALGSAAESMGARIHGPIEQARFLRQIGIEQRAAALMATAPTEKLAEIEGAVKRLLGQGLTGMGQLFKAIGISHPSLRGLPGFEART